MSRYRPVMSVSCKTLHTLLAVPGMPFSEFRGYVKARAGEFLVYEGDLITTVSAAKGIAHAVTEMPKDAEYLQRALDWLDTVPDYQDERTGKLGYDRPSGFVELYDNKKRVVAVTHEVRVEVPVPFEVKVPVLEAFPVLAEGSVTMSSREIAELTGKRHDNVLRDIREMFESLEKDVLRSEDISQKIDRLKSEDISQKIDRLRFEHIYLDAQNREQTEYLLDHELTLTLLTGYSIPLRHKVVQRLQYLENTVSPALKVIYELVEAGVIENGQALEVATKLAHLREARTPPMR